MIAPAAMLRFVLATLVCLAALACLRPATALEIEYAGRPISREILALYDGRHEKTPQTTRIHIFA